MNKIYPMQSMTKYFQLKLFYNPLDLSMLFIIFCVTQEEKIWT